VNKEPGRDLFLPPFRGRIDPAWDTPLVRNALHAPRLLFEDPGARVLLKSRNTIAMVSLPLAPDKTAAVVVKEFGLRGVNRLKSLVLASKARKAWRGASALVERHINTPPPIAFLESRKRGFVDKSYFLAGFVEDAREIRFLLRELEGQALDGLLRDVAAFLAEAHDRGVLHKDLSDGNILVGTDPRGGWVFYLLDTNRVRTRDHIGGLARMKNLVRLGIPPDRQDLFLESYGRGKPFPKILRRWYKFQKACYAGRVNFKKRLRLKQLARKLGLQ
jgi:hypothetical protein